MDWLARLNRCDARYSLGGGACADVLHWWHAPELPDNSPHRHTYFEVCQVGTHGAGVLRAEDREFALHPHTVFVARPGVVHQIVNTASPCMELHWFALRLIPPDDRPLPRLLAGFAGQALPAASEQGERVTAAWQALRALAPAAGEDALRCVVTALLLTIAEAFAPPAPHGSNPPEGEQGASPAARWALRYIEDNLDRPLGAEEVARQVGVSRRHLSRLMRRQTGVSFHEYVLSARLRLATHLLVRSDLPVKVIGAHVGYGDVHHFTRVFSRQIGCPPAAYRRGTRPQVPKIQSPGTLF